MITYKVSPVFKCEHTTLFDALFPGQTNVASSVEYNVATYSFNDDTVLPVDLGPLVRVELIPNP